MRFVGAACAVVLLALGLKPAQAQDAVAFQLNAGHTGSVSMPGFQPPLKLLWKRALTGAGISYPLIADGRVFVTMNAYLQGDYSGTNLIALDAATGKTLWKKYINNQQHSGIAANWSNATYDNGQVFVIDRFNVLTSYDPKTGKINWSQLQGPYNSSQNTSPPTAFGGSIYLNSSGVSETRGMSQWTGSVHGIGPTSPAIGDQGMYEVFDCNYYKFRLSDGAPLWHDDLGCSGGGGKTPQFIDNQVIVREPSGLVANSILNADSGATLGTFPQLGLSTMVPALYDNGGSRFMVIPNGTSLVNYDITNPASVSQSWSVGFNGETMASAPLVVNGYVIEGTTAGGLYLLSLQGEKLWSAKLGLPVAPTDERSPQPLSGLGAGDGILVVPAQNNTGNTATLFAFAPG